MSDDEITLALLMSTEFDPSRFELLPDGPWVESLRRHTGQKDLFVYRHRKTGKFGLAQWAVKPKVMGQGVAVATEIALFSAPPDTNPKDLPDFAWLCWRCQPGHIVMEEGQKKLLEQRSIRHLRLLDRKSAMDEMEKVLRKRGLDEAADKLSLEDVPEDDEELGEMRDMLNWAMHNKVTSTTR